MHKTGIDVKTLALAGTLRRVTAGVMVFIAVATLAGVALNLWPKGGPLPEVLHVAIGYAGLPGPVSAVLTLAESALILLALGSLRGMLGVVQGGQMFSAAVMVRFRRFVLWLACWAAFTVVVPLVAAIIVALASHGPVTLGLDSSDLLFLLLSGVLFFVARLFDEAARYAEDSDSII